MLMSLCGTSHRGLKLKDYRLSSMGNVVYWSFQECQTPNVGKIIRLSALFRSLGPLSEFIPSSIQV